MTVDPRLLAVLERHLADITAHAASVEIHAEAGLRQLSADEVEAQGADPTVAYHALTGDRVLTIRWTKRDA